MGGASSPISPGGILNGVVTNIIAGGNPVTGALLNAATLAGSGGGIGSSGGGFSGGGYGSIGVGGQPVSGGFGSGGGSLFGFDPSFSGIGQGVMESFRTTPIFGRDGMISNVGQAAGAYNQVGQALGFGQQPRMQGVGASIQRGGQIQPVDYMSLLNPQQPTVIRPATPSLI
jgi:hypothetical protein